MPHYIASQETVERSAVERVRHTIPSPLFQQAPSPTKAYSKWPNHVVLNHTVLACGAAYA